MDESEINTNEKIEPMEESQDADTPEEIEVIEKPKAGDTSAVERMK